MSRSFRYKVYRDFSTLFKNLMILTIFFRPFSVFAQHEADNWFFGRRVGLSFSTGQPLPLYGSPINQVEGTAVASDPKSGKLLFYTNGITVWNADHQVMSNGEGLQGSGTSTQSALIVPFPGQSGFYYLFTTRSYSDNGGGLYYSIIDLTSSNQSENSVVGDRKNTLLEQLGSEKLTAIPHANKRDFWIISHRWDSNIYLVYLLSPVGISAAREIKIGTVHRGGKREDEEAMGALKASPDSRFLAAAVYGESRPFELYDFDNRTGMISNYRSLGDFSAQYGLTFSPDNSKLYLSSLGEEGSYQFDLANLSFGPYQLQVADSTGQNLTYVSGAMQIGPDGKVYVASIDRPALLVINSPDSSGERIDLRGLHLDLKGGRILEGLPNFLQSTFNTSPSQPDDPETTNCGEDLFVYPNPVVQEKFTVQMDSSGWRINCKLLKFKVYFVNGTELLFREFEINDTFDVNVKTWPAGLYILVFEYEKKRIVRKLVKI